MSETVSTPRPRALLGVAAVVFSVLYVVSDLLEGIQGGFSAGQLWLTLVAEAAIPFLVIGLYLAQRPTIVRSAAIAAGAYAYASSTSPARSSTPWSGAPRTTPRCPRTSASG